MIKKQNVQKASRVTLADVAREASVSVATASQKSLNRTANPSLQIKARKPENRSRKTFWR